MVITRLGKGVDETGRFDPDALARTVEVLERYCRQARHLGAERIRVAATSAVRDAENREAFADAVLRLAGSELEVISGEREAGLSFLGGTLGLDPAEAPVAVPAVRHRRGLDRVRDGRRAGSRDRGDLDADGERPPDRAARAITTRRRPATSPPSRPRSSARLDEAEAAVPNARDARTLVAVAGTATTLQAIALGLERYDPEAIHRSWLTLADAERILLDLARMTNAERAALPVMAPGRGDVMVAGTVIFVETLRRFGFERALVSETDILDGLAFELLGIR